MSELSPVLQAKIEEAEAAMKRHLTDTLYGGPSTSVDPRFAPLTPAQQARVDGFYWVRDRKIDGSLADWRVDEWRGGYWATAGSEGSWRLEPDEIGPMLESPK